jgi:xanthine dehydrogenase molybdopterin-binding subunit B
LERPQSSASNLTVHPQVPGFVDFVGAADIPLTGRNAVFGDALFADGRVDYVGQRLGLILAHSQVRVCQSRRAVMGFTSSSVVCL